MLLKPSITTTRIAKRVSSKLVWSLFRETSILLHRWPHLGGTDNYLFNTNYAPTINICFQRQNWKAFVLQKARISPVIQKKMTQVFPQEDSRTVSNRNHPPCCLCSLVQRIKERQIIKDSPLNCCCSCS